MIDNAKSIADYISLWLQRQKAGNDLVPAIQRLSEVAEWQVDAWNAIREEAPSLVKDQVNERLARAAETLKTQLPLPPQCPSFVSSAITTATTAGSMSTYDAILQIEDLHNISRESAEPLANLYMSIQVRSDRKAETRRRLNHLFSSLVSRFDAAADSIERAMSQPGQIPLAAVEARNLLDGLKGGLFEKARRIPKENMTWERMSDRLGTLPDKGSASKALRDQKSHHSALFSRLSDIAKHKKGGFSQDLNKLWPLILDHIFVICGSICDPSA
ncbi:MAG: hypothetical protein KJ687_07905 [Proteobacteria bacterium]|nr:hypothetical protein [Pseudomonadota bacterium]